MDFKVNQSLFIYMYSQKEITLTKSDIL